MFSSRKDAKTQRIKNLASLHLYVNVWFTQRIKNLATLYLWVSIWFTKRRKGAKNKELSNTASLGEYLVHAKTPRRKDKAVQLIARLSEYFFKQWRRSKRKSDFSFLLLCLKISFKRICQATNFNKISLASLSLCVKISFKLIRQATKLIYDFATLRERFPL